MAGVYEALTRGLETGYGLGRQRDLDAEQRRQTAVREQRQAAEDERTAKADTRAGLDLALREQREARQESQAEERTRWQRMLDTGTLLGGRQKQIVEESTARQRAGMPVDEAAAAEYGQNQAALAKIRQRGLDFFSRTQTGQADPMSVPPGELYMNLTAATGMLPEELAKMPAHIKDIEAGLQTSNQGLVIQGTNGLLASQLRRGVGGPDPHGGTIVKKEIVGLDPARDASGRDHPNRVIPRLRVYVDHPRMTGPKMENGATGYYDAPMTQNGSTDPNDKVVALDMDRAFNFMGNMGVLAEAVQRPDVAARLAQGAKEAGPAARKYIDDLTALSRPAAKKITRERTDLGDRTRVDEVDEAGRITKTTYEARGARPLSARAGGVGVEPTLSPSTRRKMAEQYLAGDKSVMTNLGRGAQGAANVVALREAIADVADEMGMEGPDIALRMQEFMGLGAAQRALGTRTANFGIAKEEAYKMADLVTETSAMFPRTDFIPVNKALVAYEKNTGDVPVRQFGAAINSFINAYARAISPTGAPTVSDKDHARAMLSEADSHAAVQGVISILKREMEAAGAAPGTVKEQIRSGFRGGAGKQPASFADEAAAAAAAKAGKIKVGDRITINGQSGTWQ